jgi:hypothetical protein
MQADVLPYVEMFHEIQRFRGSPDLNPDQAIMLKMLDIIEAHPEGDLSPLVDALVIKYQKWKGPQKWGWLKRGVS